MPRIRKVEIRHFRGIRGDGGARRFESLSTVARGGASHARNARRWVSPHKAGREDDYGFIR